MPVAPTGHNLTNSRSHPWTRRSKLEASTFSFTPRPRRPLMAPPDGRIGMYRAARNAGPRTPLSLGEPQVASGFRGPASGLNHRLVRPGG